MATLVAYPQQGKEGSGLQCWHFIEGGGDGNARWRWTSHSGFDANLDKKIIEFLSMEFILTYICDLQYHSKCSSPTSNGGKAKDRPSCL
jgi:hypothetical protein